MNQRPLRILISTGIFPNRVRGNRGIYNLKQAAALRQTCEVRVVAPVPFVPRFLSRAYPDTAAVPATDTIGGFDVVYPRYVVTPKVGRSLHGFLLYLSVVRKYRRIVAEFRPDLILGFFAYPYGFANALLGRALGIPVVTSCRGSDINLIARSPIRGRLIAWSLRRCARVFSVSAALRERIVDMGVSGERVVVVSNGIDTDRFRPMDRSSARKALGQPVAGKAIVAVSRLGPEKGIDVLVRALSMLEDRSVRLVVVGDGPEEPMLKSLVTQLGLDDRVSFAGDRPHDEVPTWIASGDIFALPSRFEGYPNAVVEALACGRPVVASRVGGVPEIITAPDLGITVESDEPDALARALDRALTTDWNESSLVAAGSRRSWSVVADEMNGLFRQILENESFAQTEGAVQ